MSILRDFILKSHSFRPSGLPLGQNSDEDIAYAKSGENFNSLPAQGLTGS